MLAITISAKKPNSNQNLRRFFIEFSQNTSILSVTRLGPQSQRSLVDVGACRSCNTRLTKLHTRGAPHQLLHNHGGPNGAVSFLFRCRSFCLNPKLWFFTFVQHLFCSPSIMADDNQTHFAQMGLDERILKVSVIICTPYGRRKFEPLSSASC